MNQDPNPPRAQTITAAIRERCTTKAMADQPWPCHEQDPRQLESILAAAGEAPFHKASFKDARNGGLHGNQPWRCYHLDAIQCRALRQHLLDNGDSTKIPKMLAVANYLIQVTWIPNPQKSDSPDLFEPSIQNMEHIAAASAAIQNMLLAATAQTLPNYWSSGGALRTPETFTLLGIPPSEILLGSLFLFPADISGAQTSTGSMRNARSRLSDWARPVSL